MQGQLRLYQVYSAKYTTSYLATSPLIQQISAGVSEIRYEYQIAYSVRLSQWPALDSNIHTRSKEGGFCYIALS
jgi:hypothetical protein